MTHVPCNGCTACCKNEAVILFPEYGDDLNMFAYEEVKTPEGESMFMLQHKLNGECIYLDQNGCTIHDRAPIVCREFDCRRFFLSIDRNERRQLARRSETKAQLFKEARKRLDTLTPAEQKTAIESRLRARPEVSDRTRLLNHMLAAKG